jgi:hypothetical protein
MMGVRLNRLSGSLSEQKCFASAEDCLPGRKRSAKHFGGL